MRGITDTVKHLLIINVLMFIGTYAIGQNELFYSLFALFFPGNDLFQPWQVLTHMFMHGGIQHILFNMLALWMFGTAVEQVFGKKKFIFFYFSAGLGAAGLQIAYLYFKFNSGLNTLIASGFGKDQVIEVLASSYNRYDTRWLEVMDMTQLESFVGAFNTTMVGASGAIMGILVAFGMLFPNSKLMLIFFPVPVKAKYFIPGIIALDLFSALTGVSIFSPSNTAYVAHIGGALTGFLMMYFWKKDQFDKYRWN
ncbi:rhomboid family intramembrane serine protease [Pontimicrobium sp. IMCC45349]|uniref:rhomboid family intramembrane serine protease n=1 Tax=Pontimicrobium sp. IMCC45349 TaxID=3391574 RepID=UPI0039A1F21C